MREGFCIKKQTIRTSQCVQRTLQYLRTFSSPWDCYSIRLREILLPNPFAQVFCHENMEITNVADKIELVKQITLWFKEFGKLKLIEKTQILLKNDEKQGEPKVLKFVINQKAFIMISIVSGNWNNNVVHIISMMLSNRIRSSIIFDIGWQAKTL